MSVILQLLALRWVWKAASYRKNNGRALTEFPTKNEKKNFMWALNFCCFVADLWNKFQILSFCDKFFFSVPVLPVGCKSLCLLLCGTPHSLIYQKGPPDCRELVNFTKIEVILFINIIDMLRILHRIWSTCASDSHDEQNVVPSVGASFFSTVCKQALNVQF